MYARKDVMNLKEGYMRGFEGGKGREKCCNYIMVSKIKLFLQASVRESLKGN